MDDGALSRLEVELQSLQIYQWNDDAKCATINEESSALKRAAESDRRADESERSAAESHSKR